MNKKQLLASAALAVTIATTVSAPAQAVSLWQVKMTALI